MKAIVVYESHWGNTEAVARAIAAGIGPETAALTTDAASTETLTGVDLLVAGAPVIAFSLASDKMLENMADQAGKAPPAPDLAHPSMRSWLGRLPKGRGRSAAFETRLWWSPRGATPDIERGLGKAGYEPVAKAHRFVVKGSHGPLRDGELERAREWGAELAKTMTDGYHS